MIHVPEPLPDELAAGHLGRVYTINGISKKDRVSCTIHKLVGNEGRAYSETLASLAGLSFSHYLFHHTLLPFYRAIQVAESRKWGMFNENLVARTAAHRTNPLGAMICPLCINEDVSFWGFSYWRRSHQLPGMYACPKHQTALLRTTLDSPIKFLPQDALEKAEALSSELSMSAIENPTIRRYGEICLEFLSRECSISTTQIVSCLQQRARQLQVRSRAGVIGLHLHDMARRQASGEWLTAHFSDIEKKGSSSSLCRTYTSQKIAYATRYYALALALLYDSADEAFSDLDAYGELNQAIVLQSSPQSAHSGVENEKPNNLQLALSEFLRGIPVDQACRQYGTERHALEQVLRVATKHALENRI